MIDPKDVDYLYYKCIDDRDLASRRKESAIRAGSVVGEEVYRAKEEVLNDIIFELGKLTGRKEHED